MTTGNLILDLLEIVTLAVIIREAFFLTRINSLHRSVQSPNVLADPASIPIYRASPRAAGRLAFFLRRPLFRFPGGAVSGLLSQPVVITKQRVASEM